MGESRAQFHEELAELERMALGGLDMVTGALDRAVETVMNQDVELASMVIADDDRIDGRYLEVHQGVLSLLARQAPVATDLRTVAAILHVIKHVERMGDQCVNMAKLVPLAGHEPPADQRLLENLARMGDQARRQVVQCKLAFDMMCERALSRESHGKIIAEHQMVQEKIADSYAQIRMLRLFVLETAWKIDNSSTQETRTDIAAVKYTMAKVLREVSFNALHILGSLGTTNLTPLQAMYAAAPTMGIADGVDEVHKSTVARNVLKSYRPHEGYWPTEYFPAKREKALEKFEPAFQADPELRALADGYAKYIASRA